jgi:hypothetical protein
MILKSFAGTLSTVLFSLVIAPCVYATPTYIINGGLLTGIDNIAIGSNTYNVDFIDSTYESLFGADGSGIDFNNFNDAENASLALSGLLIDDVIINAVVYDFDFITELTSGCANSGDNFCLIWTPYSTPDNNGNVNASIFLNQQFDPDPTLSASLPSTFDTSLNNSYVFADWTPVSSSVPEPYIALLVATGLFGLIGASVRRKRRD